MKLDRYNKWAQENNLPPAKLRWEMPKAQFEECWTIISPFTFVVDCEGYTHNCWENIQDVNRRVQHISEPYNEVKYRTPFHLKYSRLKLTPKHEDYKHLNLNCPECVYLPICGDVSCAQFVEHKRTNCETTRHFFTQMLKEQYLIWAENPTIIDFDKDYDGRSCLK